VGKERRVKREYDAVLGGCMTVEARASLPFEYIFPHVVFKTPSP
jgi:hypothetical protein